MRNSHFYFCTSDIVGICFLKNSDFAKDILTFFQNTLRKVFFLKNVHFSVLITPPTQNSHFFFKLMIFSHLLKLREWPIVDRGLRFLAFFIFFIRNVEAYSFALEIAFGPPNFGGVAILGTSSGVFCDRQSALLRQGSSKMTSRRFVQSRLKEVLKRGVHFFGGPEKSLWKDFEGFLSLPIRLQIGLEPIK